jgi:hypothetical protein
MSHVCTCFPDGRCGRSIAFYSAATVWTGHMTAILWYMARPLRIPTPRMEISDVRRETSHTGRGADLTAQGLRPGVFAMQGNER